MFACLVMNRLRVRTKCFHQIIQGVLYKVSEAHLSWCLVRPRGFYQPHTLTALWDPGQTGVCVCDLCVCWKPGDGGCCSSNFRNVSQLPDFHLLYFRLFAGSLQYFTQFLIGADDPSQESKYSCFPYRNLPGKMRRFNVVIELSSATGTHRAVTGLPELVERHWRKLP